MGAQLQASVWPICTCRLQPGRSLEPPCPQIGGRCRSRTARVTASLPPCLPRQCILRAAGAAWRAGCRLAFISGSPQQVDTVASRDPHAVCIENQGELQLHPGLSRVPLGAAPKCRSPPIPGVQSRGLPFFPVDLLAPGGQPQIPRLPAPIYLSPLPHEVNWFAPKFTFSSSPYFALARGFHQSKKTDMEKHHALHSRLGSWILCFSRAGASDGLDHGLGSPCSEME